MKEKPFTAALRVLDFYIATPGWYGFNKRCRATRRAIQQLVDRGFLEVNEFDQARYLKK